MASKKTKSFPYFYTVLALLVLVGICFVAYGLKTLENWMADYESALPKYVAQNVFDKYFADPDYGALLEAQGYTLSPAETKDDLINYVKAQIGDGETVYHEAVSGVTGDRIKYVVSAGETPFAQFTIIKSGETTEYGNELYMLEGYEIYYKTETTSVTVVAPSDAQVRVNGYLLDKTYVTAAEETESCGHMPGKVLRNDDTTEGIKFYTYYIDGLLFDTENITVTDKNGFPCNVTADENGVFTAEINYVDSLKEQFSETAVFFAEEYSKYAMAKGKFTNFESSLDPQSDLYTKIKTLEYYWVHQCDGYEITEQETSDFYSYSDDVFSCRVKINWHSWRSGRPDFYDYIDMTLYFHNVNGEYLIYDMQTHSGLEG